MNYSNSNPQWIAKLSGRPDMAFYSLFPKNIRYQENPELSQIDIHLGLPISGTILVDKESNGDVLIGFPGGEMWEAISKVKFTGYTVSETPRSIESTALLTLQYTEQCIKRKSVISRGGESQKNIKEEKTFNMHFMLNKQSYQWIDKSLKIVLVSYNKKKEQIKSAPGIKLQKIGS